MSQLQRYTLPLLLLLPLLAFFWQLGAVPLFDLDEGAFSAATWEMLQRGDYITTYLNGEPRFDKPILIYWLQAAAVTLVGVNEWGFRLPSAIAATLWVLAVWHFARPRFDHATALAAALITATAAGVVMMGRAATADALLNLLLTLTLFDIWRYSEVARPQVRHRVFLWLALGLLTKGPIALLIPFLVSLIWFGWQRRLAVWWRAVSAPSGWLILLLLALPWYVAEYLDQGEAFIDGFILHHNLGRFTATMEGHGGSLFYYLPALLLVLLPFSGLLVATLPTCTAARRDPFAAFLWIWFGVVFIFFSLSSTQLPHYILYGATPLFLLMAQQRQRLRSRWLAYLPPLLALLLFALLPELLAWQAPLQPNSYLREMLSAGVRVFDGYYRTLTFAALLLIVLLLLTRTLSIWRGLATIAVMQTLLLSSVILPAIGAIQQQPLVAAAKMAAAHSQPVVMWRLDMPSFTLYRGAITPKRLPAPGEWFVTRSDRLAALDNWREHYRAGGIVLAERLPAATAAP